MIEGTPVGPLTRIAIALTALIIAMILWDGRGVAGSGWKASEPPPPGWKVLRNPVQPHSSTCIGDPKTPICAVETALACIYLARADFCQSVGYPDPWNDSDRKSLNLGNRLIRYSIFRSQKFPVSENKMTWWDQEYKKLDPKWRIITSEIDCEPYKTINKCYRSNFFLRYWYLKQDGPHWTILESHGIAERDVPYLKW
jgi:hypothetical protein